MVACCLRGGSTMVGGCLRRFGSDMVIIGVKGQDRARVGRRRAERNTVSVKRRLVDQRRCRLQRNDSDVDRIVVGEGCDNPFMVCLTHCYHVGSQDIDH